MDKEKIGILVFYIDLSGVDYPEMNEYMNEMMNRILPEDATDMSDPLNLYSHLFVPNRNDGNRIEVIRNDGKNLLSETTVKELEETILKYRNELVASKLTELNQIRLDIDKIKFKKKSWI